MQACKTYIYVQPAANTSNRPLNIKAPPRCYIYAHPTIIMIIIDVLMN